MSKENFHISNLNCQMLNVNVRSRHVKSVDVVFQDKAKALFCMNKSCLKFQVWMYLT